MSLFRWLAGTRVRLLVACMIGLGLIFGTAQPLTDWIRYASTSTPANMLIMTLMAFAMLATATFLAIYAGDRLFPGRWRERVILGKRVQPVAEPDTLAAVKGMKRYYFQFSLLIVGFIVVIGWTFEGFTQSFFAEYQRYGYVRTTLRSESTETKLDLLDDLGGEKRDDRLPEALEILDTVWRDTRQPSDIRAAALEAIGAQADYLVHSVDYFRSLSQDAWQAKVLVDMRRGLAEDLRKFLPDAPLELRSRVTFVLGAMRDLRARDLLFAELRAFPDPATQEWRNAVLALGRSHDWRALPRVHALQSLEHSDQAFADVVWATRELLYAFHRAAPFDRDGQPPKDIAAVVEQILALYSPLLKDGPIERRCLAAMVFEQLRDQRLRRVLIDSFDAPGTAGALCHPIKLTVDAGTVGWLGEDTQPLRQRYINALALVAGGDAEVLDWVVERLGRETDDRDQVKALLKDLRLKLEQGGVGS